MDQNIEKLVGKFIKFAEKTHEYLLADESMKTFNYYYRTLDIFNEIASMGPEGLQALRLVAESDNLPAALKSCYFGYNFMKGVSIKNLKRIIRMNDPIFSSIARHMLRGLRLFNKKSSKIKDLGNGKYSVSMPIHGFFN